MIRAGAAKDSVYFEASQLRDYTAETIVEQPDLSVALTRIVELYNYSLDTKWQGVDAPLPANAANFLQGPKSMAEFGAGIATLGYKTTDLSQGSADQTGFNPSGLVPKALDAQTCTLARELNVKRPGVPHARDHASFDYGNPPPPTFVSAWFPVPRTYADEAPGATPSTPPLVTSCDELCIHGELALQEDPSPTILVVHGIFDSASQHYIRSTSTTLFSLGYNVIALDLRDHGATLAAYPDAATTLGVLEASDLLQVAQHFRTSCAPTYSAHGDQVDPADWKVGAVGFSFGGRTVVDAYLHPDGTQILDGGALAVSPPLDMRRAIEWFEVTRYGAFHWQENGLEPSTLRGTRLVDLLSPPKVEQLLQQAIVLYFSSLIDLRWSTLLASSQSKPADTGSACAYVDARVQSSYPDQLNLAEVILDRDLGEMSSRLESFDRGSAPPLAIVESRDDPVVVWDLHVESSGKAHARYLKSKRRLLSRRAHPARSNGCITAEAETSASFDMRALVEGRDSVLLYELERGGHISFAGVSQPLSRCFLRTYFGRSTGRAEAEQRCSYTDPRAPSSYRLPYGE